MFFARKLIAKITGGKLVLLRDFDGDVSIRTAYKIGSKLVCQRMGLGVRTVELIPDGTVRGCIYVDSWEEL